MSVLESTATAEVFLKPQEASVTVEGKAGGGLVSVQVRSDGMNLSLLLTPEEVEELAAELAEAAEELTAELAEATEAE
jgi:DNA-binding protein YbaB